CIVTVGRVVQTLGGKPRMDCFERFVRRARYRKLAPAGTVSYETLRVIAVPFSVAKRGLSSPGG
ncbi:hypothetical protein, partial [Klebsiella pneumoniae]|uniref:hypothetical protein n=1 Tax=Klebsiella pneumoniae TaxID=573 RepID=UPI00256ECC5C